MDKNIIETLSDQHGVLKKNINEAVSEVKNKEFDIKKIDELLKKFSRNLNEHMRLENKVFYANLLKKAREENKNVENIIEYIDEMKKIGGQVYVFLSEYKDVKNIENNIDKFTSELKGIRETLLIRIESEETGIFSYWKFKEIIDGQLIV